MKSKISDIEKIYTRIDDEISRKIFLARLNMSISSDCSHIIDLSDNVKTLNADILTFRERLRNIIRSRTIIFGAGFNGQNFVYELLKGNVFAFIDNYVEFTIDPLNKLPVYRPEEYIEKFGIDDTCFVISVNSRSVADEMYRFLIKNKVENENIVIAPIDYRNNASQYFDVFEPGENESFVDCGAFDGSTAYRFAGWCGNKGYKKIWCFEPDMESYLKCKKVLSRISDCVVYNLGVSDENKEVMFYANGSESAHIEDIENTSTSENKIQVVKLDEVLKSETVTFIKMDIEGEEINALKGASEIIKTQKPRLAISAYHKGSDMIDIACLISELVPEYRFILRHYSLLINETVLYAYVK